MSNHLINRKENVIGIDGAQWDPLKEKLYSLHLDRVLNCLKNEMGTNWFSQFTFLVYLHPTYRPWPQFPYEGKNVILILLSDEEGRVPDDLTDRFYAIFKTYWPLSGRKKNIIPFPLGYSNALADEAVVPFEKRSYDVSFTGNFIANRLDFYRQFTFLRYLPPFPVFGRIPRTVYWKVVMKFFKPGFVQGLPGRSKAYFSGGFGTGLPPKEYAQTLTSSKIVLCPRGFISTECWRLYEALRYGCVVIADELPPSRWYKNSPIIILKDWRKVGKLVESLLSQPEKLNELQEKTTKWWNEVVSEEATAKYLSSELQTIGNQNSA